MALLDNNGFILAYTLLIAFCGATCKEINDKTHDKTESFHMFLGEVALNGFSGWLVALYATKYWGNDLITITIFAGIGGLFGFDLVRKLVKKLFNQNSDLDNKN